MLPKGSLSKVDNKGLGDVDTYIIESRGPGSGLVFRMKTPKVLIGTPNPFGKSPGKPFGKEIKLGLDTKRRSEARKKRDVLALRIRELEAQVGGDDVLYPEWSREAVKRELENIKTAERHGHDEDGEPLNPGGLDAEDLRSMALEKGKDDIRSGRVPERVVYRGLDMLWGRQPIWDLAEDYITARAPNNRRNNRPLALASVRDLRVALKYLKEYLTEKGAGETLGDVDRDTAQAFLWSLRTRTGPRAREGLHEKTIDKHATLLRKFWDWARSEGHLPPPPRPSRHLGPVAGDRAGEG